MRRAVRAIACVTGLTVPLLASAQGQVTAPAFEVASVKPNDGTGPSSQRTLPNGTLVLTNNTLRNIIRNAFGVQGAQVVGGPDWLDTARFDVMGKAAAPFSTEEGRAMLRALIADRFGVLTHREQREAPVYTLRRARADARPASGLTPSVADCTKPGCGLEVQFAAGAITGRGVTMGQLARNVMGAVGRIVVDETGLTGSYDITLTFTPDATGAGPGPAAAASIFTAFEEQLGLKLEPARRLVDVVVVDRAERPAPD